jgi:hypothetical protein
MVNYKKASVRQQKIIVYFALRNNLRAFFVLSHADKLFRKNIIPANRPRQ